MMQYAAIVHVCVRPLICACQPPVIVAMRKQLYENTVHPITETTAFEAHNTLHPQLSSRNALATLCEVNAHHVVQNFILCWWTI